MMPTCYFESCGRQADLQTFVVDPSEPRGITEGYWCPKHFEWAFYQAVDKARAAASTDAREKVMQALGKASALFMSQEVKGTEIVMPAKELAEIGDELLKQLYPMRRV